MGEGLLSSLWKLRGGNYAEEGLLSDIHWCLVVHRPDKAQLKPLALPQSQKLTVFLSPLAWMELFRAEFLAKLAQLLVGILTSRIGKNAKSLNVSLLFCLHSNQRRWLFRNKISTLKKLSIPLHAKKIVFTLPLKEFNTVLLFVIQ